MEDLDRLALALGAGLFALPDGPALLWNARPGPGLDALGRARLICAQDHRGPHDALAAAGLQLRPGIDEVEGPLAAALVLLPRSRAEALGAIARAARLTDPGGPVAISGAKTDGIDVVMRRLREHLPVESLAKGHGKVVVFARPDGLPEAFATWEAEAAPARNAEGFVTAPGMFSHAHADPGSRALATALAGRLSGEVAELGGGYGWLAAALLETCPKIDRMTVFEASHAACRAARENIADPRAGIRWADVTTLGAGDGPAMHVVTNPPFHSGRTPDPALGRAFIAAATRILAPKGRLWLVANRHLPYEATLAACFREWRAEPGAGGYKILVGERPKRR